MTSGAILSCVENETHRRPDMETDIVVEPSKDEPGNWYWAFIIDGGVHSDGTVGSEADAKAAARFAREEWEHRNEASSLYDD